MSLDVIKQAVYLIDDPILIMQSATVKDSIVLFGEVYNNKKPVMLSLLLNPKNKTGEVLDYSVITSIYGRKTNNLQNLINKSTIYYINENKNRTNKWLKALGVQFPSALTKYGSVNSISNSPQNVNNKSDNGTKVTAITDYEMADTKGNNSFVIAGIWQNQAMESDTVNLIKSVYPLNDIKQRVINNAENGKIVVINKNKAKNMLATIGIQPSEVSKILNLAKDSLSQPNNIVKYQTREQLDAEYLNAVKNNDMETAQRMVDEAAEKSMPNSKVRDEDGKLLVVYHGSYRNGLIQIMRI